MNAKGPRAAHLVPKIMPAVTHAEALEPGTPWRRKRWTVIAVMDMK